MDPYEQRLCNAVNSLGIGPMGLGGKTTALAVKVKMAACHTSLPPGGRERPVLGCPQGYCRGEMVTSRNLRTPLGDEVLDLRAGEQVTLSGIVYTARDEAHERMMKDGIPFDPCGAAVYHCGPVISGPASSPPGQPPLPV